MANTNQRDSIFAIGTERDDNLTGARGDDYIEGGEGNDIITGKAGNDNMTGGEGADKFFVWQNVSHRPFDDVTWVTNLVGNNIYASLEGVNFRDVTDWTFDQYFEVI